MEREAEISSIRLRSDLKSTESKIGVAFSVGEEQAIFIVPRVLSSPGLAEEQYEVLNAICQGQEIDTTVEEKIGEEEEGKHESEEKKEEEGEEEKRKE